ncbi:MAG: Dabb family protein [Clostridiales bacterium]|nr:Dabb family protein [Clostridiales bacterium]
MLKHIVFWKFLDNAEGHTKQENMEIVRDALMSLVGRVPSLVSAEVGMDALHTPASSDMCLICTFPDKEGFIAYRDHPEHQKILAYLGKVIAERKVIDYCFGDGAL